MTTFTTHFPFELFDRICYYLTNKQKAICQSVCQSWRPLFAASQYRHVHIQGQKQFKLFYLSLIRNGFYINTLIIQDVYLSSDQLESLPFLCPNVTTLTLAAVELSGTADGDIFSQWKYLKRLDQNIIPLLSFSNLSHLSIYLNHQSLTDILPSLQNAVYLKSLSIECQSLSLAELELIHEACPMLQELTLVNIHMENYLDAPVTTFASCMKVLQIQNAKGLEKGNAWIYYIAAKYPHAEQISLWNEHNQSFNEPVSPKEREDRYKAIAEIGYSCRGLRSVCFLNIPINHLFFKALEHVGTELENIGLGDMTDHTLETLKDLADSSQHVSHLTLWGWPSLCIQGMMEEMITLVGQCSRKLRSFEFSMKLSGIRNSHFPYMSLLDACSQLTHLKLDHIQTIPSQSNRHHLHLTQLTLQDCSFRNQLFEDLASHCPRLCHLDLDSCTLIDDPNKEIRIHMPQHSLQTLRINKIRPPSNYYHMRLVREVKYFYITDASKKRHVYELTDYDQQRPTNCVRIESEHVTGPYASIQCATLNELTIAGFLVN